MDQNEFFLTPANNVLSLLKTYYPFFFGHSTNSDMIPPLYTTLHFHLLYFLSHWFGQNGNIKFWIRVLLSDRGCQLLENDCDDIWTFQNFSLAMASDETTLQTLIYSLPLIDTKVTGLYKHISLSSIYDRWIWFALFLHE